MSKAVVCSALTSQGSSLNFEDGRCIRLSTEGSRLKSLREW